MSIKKDDKISPFTLELIKQINGDKLGKSTPRGGVKPSVVFADPYSQLELEKGKDQPTLTKSILNLLNGGPGHSIERMAFESNPSVTNTYAAIYKNKLRLLPDGALKRIAIQDSLVAAIVTARAGMVQSFGRPQPDRFSTGFKIDPMPGILEKMSDEQKEDFQKRVDAVQKKIVSCGSTQQLKADDHMTFSQFLGMTTRNAVTVGRVAVEVIKAIDESTGEMVFHSFRPIDAGTIYKAAPYKEAAQSVREAAFHMLEQLKNKELIPEKFKADEYSWIQVVEGRPVQAFTSEECLVHNFYPVSDVELDGYPLTPIDTAISDIITHINITSHNKLYFQNGRASRGMLVVQSEDVNEHVITNIKQQFNASINGVQSAWRMPVFGVGAEDNISWVPIDSGSRDMEFQYLSDSNSRVILSAFQMSPEELPGYSHLARGTNSQALSESNDEYKLTAARDVGLRPLLSTMQDFINARIFPLLDPVLAQICTIKFIGLDTETAEKESVRLQADMTLSMSYDELLEAVEKEPIGMDFGGSIPLNPAYQQLLDKYWTAGEILERFCGRKGASKEPSLQYFRDAFWFQMQELQQANQQMQMQQQQMAQQQAQGQPPGQPQDASQQPQDGQSAGQDPNAPTPPDGGQDGQQGGREEDLSRSLDQIIDTLSKKESDLPPSRRRLLQQHRRVVDSAIEEFQKDLTRLNDEVLEVAKVFDPNKE